MTSDSDSNPHTDPSVEDMLETVRPMDAAERARWLEQHCSDPTLRGAVEAGLTTRVSRDLGEEATLVTPPAGDLSGIAVGARIGACVMVRLIGEGAMGAVYEARQDGLGRHVAVKLMKEGLVTQDSRQRFAYEARLLASLRHPGIAQVFEYGTHEGGAGIVIPYFVMELIPEARPVTRHVAESSLDQDGVIDLFVRICDAVHFAHQHGVVHRDLKPANILVDGSGQPKVIDFGVARDLHGDAATRSFQTATGALVGTLPYMSPEQLSGDSVDTRSDVYSLGVMLYELLCGRRPFDLANLSLPDAVSLVRDHPMPAPTAPGGIGRDLVRILGKALHKDPARRYSSADGLAEDIRRYRRGLPVEARPATLTYNLRLFARRNRALVAAVAVVLVASIGAAVVSTVFAIKAERAREREAERADAAERLLASSNELSKWVMLEFIPRLQEVPGSTKLSEETVARVLEHLDGISAAADDDPRHLRTVGLGYLEAGLLQGSPSYPNLGRTDDALASLERACAAFERLSKLRPDDAKTLIDLGVARHARAEILADVGRVAEAQASYEAVYAELERLREREPGDVRLLRVLASVRGGLAELAQRRGDWDQAIEQMNAIVGLHRSVMGRLDDPRPAHRELGGAHSTLADLAASAGRPKEAQAQARSALEELELAYGAERDTMDAMADFAVAHRALGDAMITAGDVTGATAEFERSLALREKIVASHPDEVGGLKALVNVIQRLADIRFSVGGDVDGVLPLYRRQVELSRRIHAAFPDNTDHRFRLRMALQRQAQALIIAGRLAEAEPIVEEQWSLAEALLAGAPGDPRFRRGWAESVAQRAHFLVGRATDRAVADPVPMLEQAIAMFEQAVAVYDALRDEGTVLPGMLEVRDAVRSQAEACEELIEKLDELDGN